MSEEYVEELKKQIDSVFEESMMKIERSLSGKLYFRYVGFLSKILMSKTLTKNRKQKYETFLKVVKEVSEGTAPSLMRAKFKGLSLDEILSTVPYDAALAISDYIAGKIVDYTADSMSIEDEYFRHRGKQAAKTILYKDFKPAK
jgi:hypothetical protein